MKYKVTWLLLLLLPAMGFAGENAPGEARISRSVETHSSSLTPDEESVAATLEAAMPEMLLPLSNAPRSASTKKQTRALDSGFWLDVYDTVVARDDDYDGFYHQFTLNFRPQISSGAADVYADVYLSYEGRNWDLLTTSSAYRIYADGLNDVIHLTSSLDYGYYTGYYDVLIELRDANTGALLTSYGPDDEGALVGLALEDERRDEDNYVSTSVYVSGGGASGAMLLLLPLLAAVRRRVR